VSEEGHRPPHGALAYLQIPAADIAASAAFYARLFDWSVDAPQPGFEAPGLIGQWVTDRAAGGEAGPVAWIFVDDLDATLALVPDAGGEVLDPPVPDGPVRWLATIRDPGGNLLGLAAHRRSPG
jgi:predicted enzyme related to lactoylglutathione lyase